MRLPALCVLLLIAFACHAQRTAVVEAEYTYYAPTNVTIEQAKQTALQRAMTEAIAARFGTLVQQVSTTKVTNTDGSSSVDYSALGSSDVRGEWIHTIGEPLFDIDYQDHQLIIKVKVKGEAREITYLKPQFATRLLRNGTQDHHESEEFRDGDYLFMSVISPIEGYIAIFCKDDSIRCLLPAIDTAGGVERIEANKRHLFFTGYGNRLQIGYNGADEVNSVYVLFSPNPIIRPLSAQIDEGGLPVFSNDEFNRWLSEMRNHDRDLQIEVKYFYIRDL